MRVLVDWLANRRRCGEARLAAVFLAEPGQWHCERDLRRCTGLRNRMVLLWAADAVDNGWLLQGWNAESFDVWPPRYWFLLTDSGQKALRQLVGGGMPQPLLAANFPRCRAACAPAPTTPDTTVTAPQTPTEGLGGRNRRVDRRPDEGEIE